MSPSDKAQEILDIIYPSEECAAYALEVLRECIAYIGQVKAGEILVDGVEFEQLPGRLSGEREMQKLSNRVKEFLYDT